MEKTNHRISIFNTFTPQILFQNLLLYSCLIGFCVTFSLHIRNLTMNSQSYPWYFPNITSSSHYSSPLPPTPPPVVSSSAPPPENSFSPVPHLIQETINSSAVMHNMTDDELFRRAAASQESPEKKPAKVAFMFLTRGKLPLAPLWEKFFRGHDGLYSIYIHTSDQTFVDDTPKTSPFYGRRVPSKEVQWGQNSMVEAELRLLANALLDSSNQRFVLLSESDIPLFNFTTIYNYLTNLKKSNVHVYDLPSRAGRGRYNRHMSPVITKKQWRKGSQWFEMNREMALAVITDQTYYPIFKRHCKKRRCYSDEHYLPTFANIKFKGKNSGRTVMWIDWSRVGAHPKTFTRPYVTEELLRRLRNGGETCEYNEGKTDICYLFARKFDSDTLRRLLMFAPKIMQF